VVVVAPIIMQVVWEAFQAALEVRVGAPAAVLQQVVPTPTITVTVETAAGDR